MFFTGFLAGFLLGALILWVAARYWPEPQPIFQRFLRGERYSARTDVKVMLNDVNRKADESLELTRRLEERMVRLEEHIHQGMFAGDGDHRKAVYHLRREGLSPTEIARALGIGRGEVELILSLADK